MAPKPQLSRKSRSSPYSSLFSSFFSTLGFLLILSFSFDGFKPDAESCFANDYIAVVESYLMIPVLLEDLLVADDFLVLSLLFILIFIILESPFLSSKIYLSFSSDSST